MSRIYTTKTPSLKATIADIRKLNVKDLTINGEGIIEKINSAKTTILDERGTLANDELDIWNSYVHVDGDGNVIVDATPTPKYHALKSYGDSNLTPELKEVLLQGYSVIANQVFGNNGQHLMFWQTEGLTNAHYLNDACGFKLFFEEFKSDLSSLTNGAGMFHRCSNLTTFDGDLSSLEMSEGMFQNTNLSSFNTTNLNSITIGRYMFQNTNLTTFNSNLSSLSDGYMMFYNCSNLTTFNSDLSSLTDGGYMFYECTALTDFTSNLSSLTSGKAMFHGCSNLTTFNSDLSKLNVGYYMFANCGTLKSFNSDLSSLTNGRSMFTGCELDPQSVMNIVHFIPDRTGLENSTIDIGVGIANSEEQKQAFAEECFCKSWDALNADFTAKNWEVTWQFNGASTYGLRGINTSVYAKLEEVIMPTEEEIAAAKEKEEIIRTPHYQYISKDGSKFYNISWCHDSNMENSEYTLFDSLDAAIESFGVIAK